MKNTHRNNKYFLVLLGLLLIILFIPFYKPGMFFSLDGSFNDKLILPSPTNLLFIFGSLLYTLNLFLDVAIIQKLLFFGIFALLLIGSYISSPFSKPAVKLFFSMLLTFNPFVYARFLSGHYLVILGYALFIQVVLITFREESRKKYVFLSLFLILIAITSIHYLFISALYLLLYFISKMILLRKSINRNMWPMLIFVAISSILFGFMLTNTEYRATFIDFDYRDLMAFHTNGDNNLGLLPNVLALFGFWNEGERQFESLKQIIFFWPVITILLMGLSFLGFIKYLQKENKEQKINAIILLFFTVFSIIFTLGVSSSVFREFTYSFYDTFKLSYILREPHKLIGVLAIFYSLFAGYLLQNLKINKKMMIAVVLLSFIYYPAFVINFNKEIKMSSYPKEWYEAKSFLHKDTSEHRIVVFPWNSYLKFSFAHNKRIYNMSGVFFEKDMLVANNYQVKSLHTHDNSLEQMHIEGLLSLTFENKNLFGHTVSQKVLWGEALEPIGAKYVLLLKEANWRRYLFLDKQEDMEKVYENSAIIIYRNEKFNGYQ